MHSSGGGSAHAALPPHTVVEVVARRGGPTQALLFLATLALVAAAFVVGIVFGVMAILAQPTRGSIVLEELDRSGSRDRIAVVAVEGTIDESLAREVKRVVDHVLGDSSFRGVVLRVDSPGGAVSPSDRIWREVKRLRDAGLPVVASYGGIAASGGVFVSCGSDEIVCEPTATTGSVGVIASVLTIGDLLAKVGVEPVTMVAAGSPRKDDANDPYRHWTEQDRAVLQPLLDRSHAIFVDRVLTGRTGKAADDARLRSVLDGRILTADQALAAGLVDSIGYLDDAVTAVERRAGVPIGGSAVVRLFTPRPLWGNGLFGEVAGVISGRGERTTSAPPVEADRLRSLLDGLAAPRLEYRFR